MQGSPKVYKKDLERFLSGVSPARPQGVSSGQHPARSLFHMLDALQDYFRQFGSIEDSIIMVDSDNSKSTNLVSLVK